MITINLLKIMMMYSLKNKELQETIDNLKSDFTSFKSVMRIFTQRNSLEIYNLNDLWQEVFRENLQMQIKLQ